ncbi:MAG: hypothetical protein E7366_00965 [Clostridiales bacterium]|nr:hypothetical protein [Clostridiales bacterium]
MSVKPQYETYRYVGEVCRLKSQSIVECRLSGSEISCILAVNAKAVPTECVCADGEVRYSGKILLNIVYEDSERKICRAERGAEFFHKAEHGNVTPACFAKAAFTTENVSWRREGSGLYLAVVVDAALTVYGNKQMEYLVGGEDMIVKKDFLNLRKTLCVTGETEAEDEFETDYVGDILLHSETASVSRVTASAGQIDVEGEVNLNICVLKSDESVCSYERLIPFKMQVPCDEAFGKVSVCARVDVRSAHLTAGVDEEKGTAKIVFAYCLAADCYVCVEEEISVAVDAFSTREELLLETVNDGGRYLTNVEKCVERVSGEAVLSPALDGEYVLQAAVLPRADMVCRKGERGLEAEGVVQAEVLLRGTDGSYRAANLSLPVIFPLDTDAEEAELDCMVCGLNVRRKKNGETEAEATLKCVARCYQNGVWEYIGEAKSGDEYPINDAAFSVYIPRAGEDLWQVSKRLVCDPEELKKSNPDLQFPIREGERIFVYRQIK